MRFSRDYTLVYQQMQAVALMCWGGFNVVPRLTTDKRSVIVRLSVSDLTTSLFKRVHFVGSCPSETKCAHLRGFFIALGKLNMNIALTNNTITMSSLELVDFINMSRKEGEAELQHKHFLEKVVKVLGEEISRKFGSSYKDSMNRDKPCYNFPKREACLMAMSYSYELQAKVFDRMTALEAGVVPPKPTLQSPAQEAAGLAPLMVEAMKAFGFVGNHATLSANKAVKAVTNVDLLTISGNTHLIADKKALTFTPTELGQQVDPPVSAKMINRLLAEAGLQSKVNDRWEPTDEGLAHAEVLDTGKRHNSGVPVKQVKWFGSVIPRI